jgi:hypothetical protein
MPTERENLKLVSITLWNPASSIDTYKSMRIVRKTVDLKILELLRGRGEW